MQFLRSTSFNRGGGLSPLPGLFIAITLLVSLLQPASASTKHNIKLLYFFSTTCKHCIDAKPAVLALSKEFRIEGQQFGEGNPAYPFPVKPGDKKIAKEVYGLAGGPTLVVLVDGKNAMKIAGTPDIQDARVIIDALASGALTPTDAALAGQDKEMTVTGWITVRGTSFKDAHYFLSDRKTDVPVKAWLPIEAVKSPFPKKGPRLMSDVVRRPVVLKGTIRKIPAGIIFLVKEEIIK